VGGHQGIARLTPVPLCHYHRRTALVTLDSVGPSRHLPTSSLTITHISETCKQIRFLLSGPDKHHAKQGTLGEFSTGTEINLSASQVLSEERFCRPLYVQVASASGKRRSEPIEAACT